MLGPVGYAVWMGCLFCGLLLEAAIVGSALYRREFLRYLPLNLYMLLCIIGNLGVYLCGQEYGVNSRQYHFSYYFSDILLAVLMYWVVAELFGRVLSGTSAARFVRGAAGILLGATVLFAFIASHQSGDRFTSAFASELEQDLNFVGVVLVYALWGVVIKRRETRVRLVQLVLALGVYFSGVAGTYALFNLFPNLESSALLWLPTVIGLWLPLAWTYTFFRVPEGARLSPGHMLVTSH